MTERDYLARYADERPSYEFVNGEVTQKPMTKRSHTRLAEELLFRLGTYWRSRGGGRSGPEPTVNLSQLQDRRYRVPDLAYWAVGRPETDGEIFLPPTLAIEIQSPGQTLTLLRSKCREYRARGVDAAWLVLPSRRVVEVFDSEHDGVALGTSDKLTAAELPGFAVDLAELFAVVD
jgi:Uma2 family endonuclease